MFEVAPAAGEAVDDAGERGKVVQDGPSVGEGFAEVERDGELVADGEVKHGLKEVDLGGAGGGVGGIVVVQADFADGEQAGVAGEAEGGEVGLGVGGGRGAGPSR